MKLTSATISCGACGSCVSGQASRIDAFHDDDARILREFLAQLPVSHVDRKDLLRAALEQDFREAAGRCADVEADEPFRRDGEFVEGRDELQRAARDVSVRRRIIDVHGFQEQLRRLGDGHAVGAHLTGRDGGLRFGTGGGEAPFDQKNIGAPPPIQRGTVAHARSPAMLASWPRAPSATVTMAFASSAAASYIFSGVS